MTEKTVAIGLLLVAVLFSTTGQLLLKHGMAQVGVFTFELPALLRIFRTPAILLGFLLAFGGAIFWLAVLSRVDLSVAYPMLALSYVIVVFTAWRCFREPLTARKLLGVAVIVVGVLILASV